MSFLYDDATYVYDDVTYGTGMSRGHKFGTLGVKNTLRTLSALPHGKIRVVALI